MRYRKLKIKKKLQITQNDQTDLVDQTDQTDQTNIPHRIEYERVVQELSNMRNCQSPVSMSQSVSESHTNISARDAGSSATYPTSLLLSSFVPEPDSCAGGVHVSVQFDLDTNYCS